MASLEDAIEIALKAHWGQRDLAGKAYILHPLRVMHAVQSEIEKIVAVLHDVVEDTNVTFSDLERLGFSPEVIEALRLLTHEKNDFYEEYIRKIGRSGNLTALRVKLADISDNMDLSRLADPSFKDQMRRKKYINALFVLRMCIVELGLNVDG